jgi:cell division protein FtsB
MAAMHTQLSEQAAPMGAIRTRLDDQAKVLASLSASLTNLSNVARASMSGTYARLDNIEKNIASVSGTKMPTGATTNRDEAVDSLTAENDALKAQIIALQQELDALRERDS